LSPGHDFQGAGEHDAVVGNDGAECDIIDMAGSNLAAWWRASFNGQLERRLDQAVGEIGRGSLHVLLQRPRNALPFGGLERFRRGVH
jgi:hypothetical protein